MLCHQNDLVFIELKGECFEAFIIFVIIPPVMRESCVQAKAEASKQSLGGKNRRRSNISFKSAKQRPIVEYTRGVEDEMRRLVLPAPCKSVFTFTSQSSLALSDMLSDC